MGGPCDMIPTRFRAGLALICGTMICAPGKFFSARRRFAVKKETEIGTSNSNNMV